MSLQRFVARSFGLALLTVLAIACSGDVKPPTSVVVSPSFADGAADEGPGVFDAPTDGACQAGRSSIPPAEYVTPGTYTWTAPACVSSVHVVVAGAAGGDANNQVTGDTGIGGSGAVLSGTLAVTPNAEYTVIVGDVGTVCGSPANAGFAGGAALCSMEGWAGSGGGASVILLGETPLVVGGGGGGEGEYSTDDSGGAGGTPDGQPAFNGGGGGSSSGGGMCGVGPDTYFTVPLPGCSGDSTNPGQGGAGGVVGANPMANLSVPQCIWGGGGGGGMHGGAGSCETGGGGGSSYVAPGLTDVPTYGANRGKGYVSLTY